MSFGVALRKSVSIGLGGIATLASGTRGFNPSLNLNFTSGVLDPRITFTRATTATFTGSDGLIQTAAIDAARFDYNPTTLESLGLLIEEQRTNLLLNSLIDGTNLSTQTVTTTAVSQTLSFYGTGQIVLSGTAIATVVGTGAYPSRRTFTFTPTAGLLVLTVTGTVQYAQLEVGAFATSYIPTAASQVTRSADTALMTGTNFSSWYNQTEGTFKITASNFATDSTQRRVITANDTTTQNVIDISRIGSTSQSRAAVITLGTTIFNSLNTAWAINTTQNVATSYKQNNFAAVLGGGTVVTDNSGNIPVVTQLTIGNLLTQIWCGHIKQISYYPLRLPNSQLQALTA